MLLSIDIQPHWPSSAKVSVLDRSHQSLPLPSPVEDVRWAAQFVRHLSAACGGDLLFGGDGPHRQSCNPTVSLGTLKPPNPTAGRLEDEVSPPPRELSSYKIGLKSFETLPGLAADRELGSSLYKDLAELRQLFNKLGATSCKTHRLRLDAWQIAVLMHSLRLMAKEAKRPAPWRKWIHPPNAWSRSSSRAYLPSTPFEIP